jgi:uncharacterized protein (DUF2252 family)
MASIIEKINQFNAGRLPDMLQRKYELMKLNPFLFFRATAHLFYEDLVRDFKAIDMTKVWSCGDLHIQNFGTFRAENRLVYFDINDFDDAILLPASFDLTRMATSICLVSEIQKWDKATAQKLIQAFLMSYKQTLENGKALDIDHRIAEGEVRNLIKTLEKRNNFEYILTFLDKKGKRFRTGSKKLLPIDSKRFSEIEEHIDAYFSLHHSDVFKRIKDINFRVAGTSSLGLERYIILIETNKNHEDDYLLLDFKETRPSAAAPFLSIPQPNWENQAARIVSVQSRVNDVLPALFKPILFDNKSFILREMQAEEDKLPVLSPMKIEKFQTALLEMGIIAASGHLRGTGQESSSITDELIDFAHQKEWLKHVAGYAENYVLKVHADFEEFANTHK